MIRHNYLRPVRNKDFRHRDAALNYAVDFLQKFFNVKSHAITDDIYGVIVKHARRQCMQCKTSVIIDDCMSRICSALKANNDVGLCCKHIRDFAFSLVAPVGADYSLYHVYKHLLNIYFDIQAENLSVLFKNRFDKLVYKFLGLLRSAPYKVSGLHNRLKLGQCHSE